MGGGDDWKLSIDFFELKIIILVNMPSLDKTNVKKNKKNKNNFILYSFLPLNFQKFHMLH